MDDIEITVFDEINDYKEKIYFFNFRQWAFSILIAAIVIPTYLILKNEIGEEITSYIVILIAGILGFVGFVKIHELPAEKILPYWFRHYFLFAKPIKYITDEEYELLHQKKNRKKTKPTNANPKIEKLSKAEIRDLKKLKKQEKLLRKAKKKFETTELKDKRKREVITKEETNSKDELTKKLSELSKEQQDALLKLLKG